jgi:phage-related protein
MGYEIEFYKTENGHIPVEEFIKSLEAKFSAKIMRDIKLLKEFGSDLHKPYVDSIKGKKYKGLMELRTKQSSNIFRVFFFALVKDEKTKIETAVLLHGIQKKTNKTPAKDLETALARKKDYEARRKK